MVGQTHDKEVMNVPFNGIAGHGLRGVNTESFMKSIIIAILAFSSTLAFAHSGGTDSSGCHTNRKTGDYHCH